MFMLFKGDVTVQIHVDGARKIHLFNMQLLQIPDFDKFQWMLVTYNWEFVYKDQSVD